MHYQHFNYTSYEQDASGSMQKDNLEKELLHIYPDSANRQLWHLQKYTTIY